MIVQSIINSSDTFISAFLPGTSGGQGVIDAIFGNYLLRADENNPRVNTLSFDWPQNM
jgi:beta-glucosidase